VAPGYPVIRVPNEARDSIDDRIRDESIIVAISEIFVVSETSTGMVRIPVVSHDNRRREKKRLMGNLIVIER